MGKKGHTEVHERMNYLYQASILAASIGEPSMARYYAGTLKNISERTVLRV
jgi:RNase P subunit RPR2